MAVSATLIRVLLSRAARRELIMSRTADRIESQWRLTDPFDGYQVGEFAESAAELSMAAQAAIVSLATAAQLAYFSELEVELADFFPEVPPEVRLFGAFESEFTKPKNVVSGGVESLRLPVEEVFNRPARQYRAAVSSGTDPAIALEDSVNRVKLVSGTNLSLAEREAEHLIYKEAARQRIGVIGWRRVIHPEASKSGSCGLCVAASDRLYKTDAMKAIHDHCRCETLPVTADDDPGDELNRDDLDRLYDEAGGNSKFQLKRTRYKFDEHGELQAVLVPARRGQKVPHYRDPTVPQPVDLDEFAREYEVASRQLPLMERHLRQTLAKGLGEDSSPVQYQRTQIDRYKAILSR
ncbi:hypothetical protein NONI108955_20835 [Nocardia ninae]|uniref:Phage head morphogenesis domain-containing protein n=1 Tax=Nocardia ninae NBRC 108245 TaxID=1210091 RepID=A0A511M9R3_9NOCA|nr:hypothetical protein [Nocardia ninae]GEM37402.1 hypothetical protein NN4_19210 [Nocardia ninae NBRC 108245]